MKPKIVNHDFPETQYYPTVTDKTQICLHHTVSGDNVSGDINWWEQTPARVATCVIVARDGTIHKLYGSKFWAHHLGVKKYVFGKFNIHSNGANVKLNKSCIGIEIDSWGGLIERNGKYYRAGDREVPLEKVIDYGMEIRGYRYYERYTKEQIDSTIYLLKYWGEKYNIPICYNDNMWNLSEDALRGVAGVWSHVSYRPDKSDCHPQKELIEALNGI